MENTLENEMLDAAISWCDSNGINVLEPEQLSNLVNSLYVTVCDAALDTAQPALSGCACRWDADDKRVATCVRHQGWLDVVSEWAERAKAAESQQAQPEREPLTDAEIEQAVKTHGVCWAGYREDKHGFYTIPILMPYHYQFARAIEAAFRHQARRPA